MSRDDRFSRRKVLRLSGVAAGAALLAGCGDGGGPGNDTEDEPINNGEEPAENGEGTENGAGAENGDGNETEENGNETGDGNETEENGAATGDGEALEPGEIELEAQTAGWVGVSPDSIADEDNPTLTLQEGETYELGWNEGDGAEHNIEVRDENGEVIDDLSTETSTEGGDDQFLEFDASSEMAEYVCNPHQGTMNGEIQVE